MKQIASKIHPLDGVYAAALTPLKADFTPNLDAIVPLLDFLARRGCHGALLLGTTGEGPSFSAVERKTICRAALAIRQDYPNFRLLAGTGTPSLEETRSLTQDAFDLGFDGVVVLPPYYFRTASPEGLFAWYSRILNHSVPAGGAFLGYHIPGVSGVPLPVGLLNRLRDAFPTRFAGIKDSSGDPDYAQRLGKHFGKDLVVLNGNDRLLSLALEAGAAGCITALANLHSPVLRQVWDAHQRGEQNKSAQDRLTATRNIMDNYQPFAATFKALLARLHDFPLWPVRPPLLPLSEQATEQALAALSKIG